MPRDFPLERYRNIGIMAHIDAGKTTTTERILFYTGTIHRMGDVDDANTTTDWMEQERERGITITSAAITAFWNRNDQRYRINIIDFEMSVRSIKEKLHANGVPVQIPWGVEDQHQGVIDLVRMKGITFDESELGSRFELLDIPPELREQAKVARAHLVEACAEQEADGIAERWHQILAGMLAQGIGERLGAGRRQPVDVRCQHHEADQRR